MHFRETFHQWKYKEWRKLQEEKSSTFVNFHPVKFSENHDLDMATDSIKLRLKPHPLIYFSLYKYLFCEG